jgi:hypothetical protein
MTLLRSGKYFIEHNNTLTLRNDKNDVLNLLSLFYYHFVTSQLCAGIPALSTGLGLGATDSSVEVIGAPPWVV